MNVTCTGCPAKYAVPDEKVRGKKVRITCKHCGTNIVVDGTANATDEALPKPAAALAAQPATVSASAKAAVETKEPAAKAAAAPPEVMYIVGFADDRQHPHTVAQIVEMYSSGKIDDEALVWKDGMADWLSPFDVPELAAAFRAKNVAPRSAGPNFAPVAEDEATLVVRSPLDDPEVAAAIAAAKLPGGPIAAAVPAAVATPAVSAAPTAAPTAAPVTSAAKLAEEPMFGKPAAARRVEKRAGAVDLFGGVADAGSEGDASLDLGSSDERAQKLTGARNESSVLFSLDALTKPDPKISKAKDKAREEEASVALFGESAPDSLINLGGGGLSAMAAPDFTKPVTAAAIAQAVRPSDPVEVPNAPGNKGRGGVVLMVGFVSIAAIAAVAFVMMKKQPAPEPALTPSAATEARTSAEPSSPEAPAASNAPATSASAAPEASTTPATSASAAGSAAPAGSGTASATPSAANAKPPIAGVPATPAAAAAAPPAAVNKPAEPAAAAKPAEAPAPVEGAAFDKNAAVAALSAAAASAAGCKTADGPTGSGKVSVTFAPSGRATATSVAGELAGTEVGGCVARLFRSAKVPPFAGDPVTVSKSFSVQ